MDLGDSFPDCPALCLTVLPRPCLSHGLTDQTYPIDLTDHLTDWTDQTNMTNLNCKFYLNCLTYLRTSDVTLEKVFIF
jgi:hypothetical protein